MVVLHTCDVSSLLSDCEVRGSHHFESIFELVSSKDAGLNKAIDFEGFKSHVGIAPCQF